MKEVETKKMEQLFFEDVEVGSEIPPLAKEPFSCSRMAIFAAVMGDFCHLHFDYGFAKSRGRRAPFAYGLQVAAYLSQLMTDWIGPNGILKKFATQTRDLSYDGESLTMKGKVTKKYEKDGENYVECEIRAEAQDGRLIAPGSATVTLPSKSSKN